MLFTRDKMNSKIKITTIQNDYNGKTMFDSIASDLMIDETFSLMDESGTMETTLYGNAVISGDTYRLKYKEADDSGMDNVSTTIKFKVDAPECVTLIRTGDVSSIMYFEAGKRDISVYNSGVFPFEVCIYTVSLDNRLITDGYFEVCYIVEIKGAQAQKTILRLETTSI